MIKKDPVATGKKLGGQLNGNLFKNFGSKRGKYYISKVLTDFFKGTK